VYVNMYHVFVTFQQYVGYIVVFSFIIEEI
jgi:hypothetical protein